MNGRRLRAISQWASMVLVAGLLPFVSEPFQLVALAVLVLHFAVLIRRPNRLLRLAALVGVIAPPFIAEAFTPSGWTVLLALPGLPWFESVLRTTSSPAAGAGAIRLGSKDRRYLTSDGIVLILGLAAVVLVGTVTGHPSLITTACLLLSFVGVLATVSWTRIPGTFVAARAPTVRVVARDTVETGVELEPHVRLSARLSVELEDAWAKISPQTFVAGPGPVVVHLRVTPPLAGSKTVQARVLCADPWGLTVTGQDLVLAHIRVIPRATYAVGLARRYLERTAGSQLTVSALQDTRGTGGARGGLDYYGARPYEPGDPLRDVFWKHTLKLRQLVMKERRGEYGEAVILAINAWGSDAEDLDRAAFNTLLSALTLAREGVPMVFATYTDETVLSVTPVLAPRQAVLHALHVVGTMREVARPIRILPPAHLARLRRRVERLMASKADPALRLARVLQFEYRAHVSRAQHHPGYQAVIAAARRIAAPAAVLVAASGPQDPEAIELALERLRGRGVHLLIAPHGAGGPAMMPSLTHAGAVLS